MQAYNRRECRVMTAFEGLFTPYRCIVKVRKIQGQRQSIATPRCESASWVWYSEMQRHHVAARASAGNRELDPEVSPDRLTPATILLFRFFLLFLVASAVVAIWKMTQSKV